MALPRRYDTPIPFNGTAAQHEAIATAASARKPHPVSMAEVLRNLVDKEFGLVDGERPAKKRAKR